MSLANLTDADGLSSGDGPAPAPNAWARTRAHLLAEAAAERERQHALVLSHVPRGAGISLPDLTDACVRDGGEGWRTGTGAVVRALCVAGSAVLREGVVYRKGREPAAPEKPPKRTAPAALDDEDLAWGARVRARRLALGLSQAEVAKRAGRAASAISNAERGVTRGYDVAKLRADVERALQPPTDVPGHHENDPTAECPTCGNRGTGCPACRPELHERPGETYPDEEDAARYLAHVDLENAAFREEQQRTTGTEGRDLAPVGLAPGEHAAGAAQPEPEPGGVPSGALGGRPGGPGEPSPEPSGEPVSGGVEGATSPPAPGDYVLGPASAYWRVSTAEAGLSEADDLAALVARALDEGADLGVPDRSWPLEVRLGGLVTLFRREPRRGRKE